jgi:hypothetical protein
MTMLASSASSVKPSHVAPVAELGSVTFTIGRLHHTAQPVPTQDGRIGTPSSPTVAYHVKASSARRDVNVVERGWGGRIDCTCSEWAEGRRQGLAGELCRHARALVVLRLMRPATVRPAV